MAIRYFRLSAFFLLMWCGFAGLAEPLDAQELMGMDILRGQVVGPDSQPISFAQVTVKATQSSATRKTQTNGRGLYMVLFPGGSGDYLVTVRAVGMTPLAYHVVRPGSDHVLVANFHLAHVRDIEVATHLSSVKVRGKPRPIIPKGSVQEEIGGLSNAWPGNEWEDPFAGVLALDDPTHLDVLRYSVLGMDPSANALTLNGASVKTLLPDIAGLTATQSIATSDPSIGGFTGGQFSVFIRSGGGRTTLYNDLKLRFAPAGWQWVDRTSKQLGRRDQSISATWRSFGPLLQEKLYQYTYLTLMHTTNPTRGFSANDPVALSRLGIASDSAERFIQLLDNDGIPKTLSSIPDNREMTVVAWLSRFDIGQDATTSFNMVINAASTTTKGGFMSPTAVVTHGGTSHLRTGVLQLNASRYLGNGFLTHVSTTLSTYANRITPYLTVPDAQVEVTSLLPTGDSAISWINFGGNAKLMSHLQSTNWETQLSTSWLSFDSKHRYTLQGSVRAEHVTNAQHPNALGTFTYPSLANFAAGTASHFTRQFPAAPLHASGMHGHISVGDAWRIRETLRLQYGLRLDIDHFARRAPYNPIVDSLFGQRTDFVPRPRGVSPRLGIEWSYGPRSTPYRAQLPLGTVAISLGQFRSGLGAETVASIATASGLPSGVRMLDCVGASVPQANWMRYLTDPTAIPETCDNGDTPIAMLADRPDVGLFDPHYQPPTQWRASLSWNNERWVQFEVRAVYSVGQHEASVVDLNLVETPQFTLPQEANRPVYVPLSAPVLNTGAIALDQSRASPQFGRVLNHISDLHSHATFFAIQKFFPTVGPLSFSLAYAYLATQEQRRGLGGGTTAGNPFEPTWSPTTFDIRHTFSTNVSLRLGSAFLFTVKSLVRSGMPYTPLVFGDVNGDGVFNDNAFIFDPSSTTDAALANAMSTLLVHAPHQAKDCLYRQRGQIAQHNSCRGPWTAGMNLSGSWSPTFDHWPKSPFFAFTVVNLLGGLDQLLHGETHLRGWGEPSSPDPTLLVVNGFDPITRQFHYQVNPRFGKRNASVNALRTPVQIRMTVVVPITPQPSWEEQKQRRARELVEQAQGKREALKKQLQVYNPFTALLRISDTLQLTDTQMDIIDTASAHWQNAVDSVQNALIDYLVDLPKTFDDQAVVARIEAAQRHIATVAWTWGHSVRTALTDDQWTRLPVTIHYWLTGKVDE